MLLPLQRNIPRRTRAERRHLLNREAVEKARLRERRERFSHYEEPGAVVASDDRESALYIAEADRFVTDVATEQRFLREQARERKASEIARRRDEQMSRDEARYHKMEEEARMFDERTLALQADGRPAFKNKSGEAFDPITTKYVDGPEGQLMAYQDARTMYRAQLRTVTLAEKSAGSTFNPLTGEDMPKMSQPLPPAKPPVDEAAILRRRFKDA